MTAPAPQTPSTVTPSATDIIQNPLLASPSTPVASKAHVEKRISPAILARTICALDEASHVLAAYPHDLVSRSSSSGAASRKVKD